MALNFKNFSIDNELTLLMMVDSSKVATGYMSFQIVMGDIQIIDMDSRIFSEPEMAAPSVTREALGICYGLRKMEDTHSKRCSSPIVAVLFFYPGLKL